MISLENSFNSRKLVKLKKILKADIFKGAHRGKNQPVPFRGIKAFCYGEPKVCPDFQDGAKKQPVP